MDIYKEKNNEKIYAWITTIVVIAFVIFRFNDLSLPYFWDEMGVYSRAALYLAEHGISLLPAALPPELSRGHPLLFYSLYGCGFSLMGNSVLVGHTISLVVSVLLLIAVYKKAALYFNRLLAFCSVVLLCSQPVFIAQSTLILPEVALALLIFLALASYHERKLFWFAIYSCLALQVKESAIVVPFVAIAYGFVVDVILKRKHGYFTPSSILLTFSSLLLFGIFLLIQKAQNGWFFFPYHADNIVFDMERFLYHNHDGQKFLFYHQGRYWWVKVYIVAAVFALVKSKLKMTNSFAIISALLICALLVFSSFNFYMDRYFFPAFPFLIILTTLSVYTIFSNRVFVVGLILLLSLLCLRDLDPGRFNYDCDLGFKHHLKVQQKVIDKLCEATIHDSPVWGNFPLYYPLFQRHTGFQVCPQILYPIKNVSLKQYYAFISIDGNLPPIQENSKLIFYTKESFAEGFIYEREK